MISTLRQSRLRAKLAYKSEKSTVGFFQSMFADGSISWETFVKDLPAIYLHNRKRQELRFYVKCWGGTQTKKI